MELRKSFFEMAMAPWALALLLPLVLILLSPAPTPTLGGCPSACRCSFAMLQCLEPNGITSIPPLALQESENVTEMWVRCAPALHVPLNEHECVRCAHMPWCWLSAKLDFLSLCSPYVVTKICFSARVLVLMGQFSKAFTSDVNSHIRATFLNNLWAFFSLREFIYLLWVFSSTVIAKVVHMREMEAEVAHRQSSVRQIDFILLLMLMHYKFLKFKCTCTLVFHYFHIKKSDTARTVVKWSVTTLVMSGCASQHLP